MANSTIGLGNLITALEFNELVASYSTYWSDDSPDIQYSTLNETTVDLHSKGWGQYSIAQNITPTTVIYGYHTNKLVTQLNAGILHSDISGGVSLVYSTQYEPGQIIYASSISQNISSHIEGFDTNSRFNLNPLHADFMMDTADAAILIPTINGQSTLWSLQAVSKARATFNTYQEARYFLNSGGKIIFDLEGNGGNPRGEVWERVFNIVGEIHAGAVETTNTGPLNPTFSYGVYDVYPGQDKEIFSILVDRGSGATGEYGYGEYGYGEYGGSEFINEYASGYSGSEYDSALIKLKLQCTEDTDGKFHMDFTVILEEDSNISNLVDLEIDMTVGYVQPLDAPYSLETVMGTSNESYFNVKYPRYPSDAVCTHSQNECVVVSGVDDGNGEYDYTVVPATLKPANLEDNTTTTIDPVTGNNNIEAEYLNSNWEIGEVKVSSNGVDYTTLDISDWAYDKPTETLTFKNLEALLHVDMRLDYVEVTEHIYQFEERTAPSLTKTQDWIVIL
jgi:hypothetical protein